MAPTAELLTQMTLKVVDFRLRYVGATMLFLSEMTDVSKSVDSCRDRLKSIKINLIVMTIPELIGFITEKAWQKLCSDNDPPTAGPPNAKNTRF